MGTSDTSTRSCNFDTGVKKTFTIANLSTLVPRGICAGNRSHRISPDKEVKEVSYFTVFSPKDKNIPTPTVNYFQPLKMSAEPGEKASFVAGSSEKKLVVFMK